MSTLDDPFSRVPSVPELRLTFSNEELMSMACAAGGLFAVHIVVCAALRVFCSGWLNSLPPKERHDVGIRLGSSVWGVVSTTWAAVLLLPRWWDTVYGHPVGRLYADPPFETCNLLFAAAIGYFLWDLATTLYYGYGAEYVFHAVISIMVYAVPKLMPPSFLQFYGCFFILWEVSLPFVNVRHVLIKAGMANTFLFNFVQFMGFGLFLFIRLLVGLPIIIRYAMDVWELHKAGRMERAPVYLLFVVGGFAFQCINFFWIYAIYKSVFKKRGGKGKKKGNEVVKGSNTNGVGSAAAPSRRSQDGGVTVAHLSFGGDQPAEARKKEE